MTAREMHYVRREKAPPFTAHDRFPIKDIKVARTRTNPYQQCERDDDGSKPGRGFHDWRAKEQLAAWDVINRGVNHRARVILLARDQKRSHHREVSERP